MGRFGNRQYFYKKKGNQQASANDSGPHGQQASASQPSLHGQRSSDGSAAPQATSSGRGLTSLPEFNVCVSCMLKNYKVRVGKFTKGRKYCDECDLQSPKRAREDSGEEDDARQSRVKREKQGNRPVVASPASDKPSQHKSQKDLDVKARRWCFRCHTMSHDPDVCRQMNLPPEKHWQEVCLELGWVDVTGFWSTDTVARFRPREPTSLKEFMNHLRLFETDMSNYVKFVYQRDRVLQSIHGNHAVMIRVGGNLVFYHDIPFYESIFARANKASQYFMHQLESSIHTWYKHALGGHVPQLPGESAKQRNFRASKMVAMSTHDSWKLNLDEACQLATTVQDVFRQYEESMNELEQEYDELFHLSSEVTGLDVNSLDRRDWRIVSLPTTFMRLALYVDSDVSWFPIFETPLLYEVEEYLNPDTVLAYDFDHDDIMGRQEAASEDAPTQGTPPNKAERAGFPKDVNTKDMMKDLNDIQIDLYAGDEDAEPGAENLFTGDPMMEG